MNRQEAEELLPWFVAGTLDEDEAKAVQAFIDSGEIAREELDALQMVADTVAVPGADEPVYDPAILRRVMGQLDGVTQEAPQEPLVVGEAGASLTHGATGAGSRGAGSRSEDQPGLIQRILTLLQWSATPPLARVLVAAQFALLLGLVMVVAGRDGAPREVISETVAGPVAAQTAAYTLSFSAGASEAEVRALLLANGMSIVAGPSALGIYHVAIPEDADPAALAAALSTSELVVFLQPVIQP